MAYPSKQFGIWEISSYRSGTGYDQYYAIRFSQRGDMGVKLLFTIMATNAFWCRMNINDLVIHVYEGKWVSDLQDTINQLPKNIGDGFMMVLYEQFQWLKCDKFVTNLQTFIQFMRKNIGISKTISFLEYAVNCPKLNP